jgi:hypothetical protein
MNEDDARQIVSELYRGILKREPDEGGLQAYAAALAADGSAGHIAEILRAFRTSPEAELIADRLRGLTVRQRPARLGPINHLISLGTDCYASFAFKLMGVKRASYPFDWILSTPSMVADVLQNDFCRFLDPKYHRATPLESRRSPLEGVCDHLFYQEHFGVDRVFMHRDVTAETDREYYRRAVERFRAVMRSEQTKLLLMTNIAARHASAEDFAALCEIIDGQYRNAKLLVLNFQLAVDGDVADVGSRLERECGEHQLIEFRSSSKLNGMTFSNWLDDLVIRGIVGQYEMNLAG